MAFFSTSSFLNVSRRSFRNLREKVWEIKTFNSFCKEPYTKHLHTYRGKYKSTSELGGDTSILKHSFLTVAKPAVLKHHCASFLKIKSPGGLVKDSWALPSEFLIQQIWRGGECMHAVDLGALAALLYASPSLPLSPCLPSLNLAKIPFLGEHLQDLPHSSILCLEKNFPPTFDNFTKCSAGQWQENNFFWP